MPPKIKPTSTAVSVTAEEEGPVPFSSSSPPPPLPSSEVSTNINKSTPRQEIKTEQEEEEELQKSSDHNSRKKEKETMVHVDDGGESLLEALMSSDPRVDFAFLHLGVLPLLQERVSNTAADAVPPPASPLSSSTVELLQSFPPVSFHSSYFTIPLVEEKLRGVPRLERGKKGELVEAVQSEDPLRMLGPRYTNLLQYLSSSTAPRHSKRRRDEASSASPSSFQKIKEEPQ